MTAKQLTSKKVLINGCQTADKLFVGTASYSKCCQICVKRGSVLIMKSTPTWDSRMASRLDPHTLLIFDLLTRQGNSFRSVCKVLQQQGVAITPQSLQSWYHRRCRKISLRSQKMEGVDLSALRPGRSDPTISSYRNTPSALTATASSMKIPNFKEQIEREEFLLKSTPFTTSTKKLPIPPKSQNFNEENK